MFSFYTIYNEDIFFTYFYILKILYVQFEVLNSFLLLVFHMCVYINILYVYLYRWLTFMLTFYMCVYVDDFIKKEVNKLTKNHGYE